MTSIPPVALSIAGFDPSGGAGVLADIRTFQDFGCFGAAAVTSLTFQNTKGVFGACDQAPEVVRAQLLVLLEDFEIAAAKTGMLPTAAIISEVAGLFRDNKLPPPVVDPVISSTSGYELIDEEALQHLMLELVPLARVVTPNIDEAERICGIKIHSEAEMCIAARAIREQGARAVLVKGGHLRSDANDVLDDDGAITVFRGKRLDNAAVHGTGCALSAAIAAGLTRTTNLADAVRAAKAYVTEAIHNSKKIGRGLKITQ